MPTLREFCFMEIHFCWIVRFEPQGVAFAQLLTGVRKKS